MYNINAFTVTIMIHRLSKFRSKVSLMDRAQHARLGRTAPVAQ